MLKVARILKAYCPESLTKFKDSDTNSAAYDLFQRYIRTKGGIGRAIALTRRDLMAANYDMTPAPSEKFSIPPSIFKKKKPEEAPALFSYEELKYSSKKASAEYPLAPAEIDGLVVGSKVPNTGSIRSTYEDYTILPGIRMVPMSDFTSAPHDMFYAKNDIDHARNLSEQIKHNGRIDPLIVVLDDGGPYVLEGGHRLAALHILGKKAFPALVVVAND